LQGHSASKRAENDQNKVKKQRKNANNEKNERLNLEKYQN
jgi:hypothetical protein